jgi:hypothetical protein
MSMVELSPREIGVVCDLFTGQPRAVRVGPDTVPVVAIERIREETAAYPADRGPRTIFVVRTLQARLRLSFQHRERRWLMEGIEPGASMSLAPAA